MEDRVDWWSAFLAAVSPGEAIPSVLLAIAVVLIFRGLLVPRSTLQDAWSERDSWKQAYLASEKSGQVKDAQISELLEHSRTTTHAFRSLSGGDHVAENTQPLRQPPSP